MTLRPWTLGWLVVTAPSEAAERTRAKENLPAALKVYASFLVLSALFYYLKPFDFPDTNAGMAQSRQGLLFWLGVMCYQPLLLSAWVVFMLALSRWFEEGMLFFKMTVGVGFTAAALILVVAYAKPEFGLSKGALFAGFLAWAGLLAWYARLGDRTRLREVGSFMAALNAIGVALLVPQVLFTLTRSQNVYMTVQGLGGLWLLGAAAAGLRKLTGLRMSRAFMAVLLSMLLQIAFTATIHYLGFMPEGILKALLYA